MSMDEDIRLRRIKALKTLAQRVINHAEDFVGTTDMAGDISVTLNIPTIDDTMKSQPSIDISKVYYSKKAMLEMLGPDYEDMLEEDDE